MAPCRTVRKAAPAAIISNPLGTDLRSPHLRSRALTLNATVHSGTWCTTTLCMLPESALIPIRMKTHSLKDYLLKHLLAALCLAALATPAFAQPYRDTAEVVSAYAQYRTVNRPTERCWYETSEPMAVPSERSPAGAIVGAIAGGILGHQVGNGFGRDIATGIGTFAGAIVGDNVANTTPSQRASTVRRCIREDSWVREISGFEVTYRYANKLYTTTLPRDPGRNLEVEVSVVPLIR